MKKLMIIATTVLLASMMLQSCEKEITVELPEIEQKIVVEGWIEQGQVARVILTKSSPYFSAVDSNSLAELLILDAVVTVSDGIVLEQLALTINPDYFPPLVYTGSTMIGEIGKTYSLKVEAEGKTLTASTIIPQPVSFDSLWFQTEPKKDSLGYVWATYSDPAGEENFYRIFTKRHTKDRRFIPLYGSVYDDQFFNGKSFTFSMFRGVESLSDPAQTGDDAREELGYFKVGDTIVVKNCAIDKTHYEFWRSAETVMFSGGNPFVTPSAVKANVNGGYGVWGGYGATYDTIIAIK